jgi:hypothetical protein
MKVALALAEVVTLALVLALLAALGLPWGRAAIYAWNPLLLVEVWGSAHLDALALLAVAAATLAAVRGAPRLAALLLGVGTLVKIYPALLLPLLLGAGGASVVAVWLVTVGVGSLALAQLGPGVLGSLPRYLAEEHFNPGLVRTFVDSTPLAVAALVAWVGWTATRRGSFAARAVPLVGGAVVLGPNVFPWYAVWLVPFLALAPSLPWIAFTGTVAAAYAFFVYDPWAVPLWARLLEVAPLAAGGLWQVAERPRTPGPRREARFHTLVTIVGARVLRWLTRRPVRTPRGG